MPAPGDQHRDNANTINPFIDKTPHITEYTAQEIATLQSRLDKQLGPEYISTRPGNGGGKVHYLAAEKVINLANEVFGFNGWSSSIINVQIDFVDENPTNGKINLGLSTIVRVTLKDGTFHEDTGYGHCENTKGKAAAFEKAKKEAATDAMKRALRNFGNVLGNCLYDKDYLSKITKVKATPSRWDEKNLHRHPDFAPIKQEPVTQVPQQNNTSAIQRNTSVQSVQSAASFGSGEFEDDFGGTTFDETDFNHPDEVMLEDSTITNGAPSPARPAVHGQNQNGQRQGVPRTHSMPQMRPPNQQIPAQGNVQPPAPVQGLQAPQRPQPVSRPPMIAGQPAARMLPPQTPGNAQRPQQYNHGQLQPNHDGVRSNPSSGTMSDSPSNQAPRIIGVAKNQPQGHGPNEPTDEHGFPIPREPPQGIPSGFVTGRKAEVFNQPGEARPTEGNIAFNPHADSPSIRRTQGINPGKSAPISRAVFSNGHTQSPAQQQPAAAGNGFQSAASNGFNGAQRPAGANYINPSADMSRKIGMPGGPGGMQNRSAYRPPAAVKRPAMADVTNTHGMDGASDPKKAKVDDAATANGENAAARDPNGVTT
ncbi:DNA repair and recombination protein rhm52 [Fulvia fulva]|nr:DNA repair and recombination protein rhm52 [Fulvia fulva]KAK4610931.1 DNA repair and recombination protein rhm52 [Fulvia fulva]WPV22307.1 DNA repair and recombination protein rhm52 [Fulvia fulva]WPV36731.1 DNA repair and recombination protein rhm52 [Fulvia fulva]